MNRVIINTKIVGKRGPALTPLVLETSEDRPTLCALIEAIVREQVGSFRDRQQSRRLLHILTEKQMAAGVEAGKLAFGGDDLDQAVDVDAAIDAACTAFQDGLFFVFLDGAQVMTLNETVELGSSTEALFVRLVPLAGG